MSAYLTLAAEVFKELNLPQPLVSFSMTEFPYNCALSLFNKTIRYMNRKGHYWFTETNNYMGYNPGQNLYRLSDYGQIDPKAIKEIRLEKPGFYTVLTQMNSTAYRKAYSVNNLVTGKPTKWCKYNDAIEFNTIADQDYSPNIYYYRDIPLITSDTDATICQLSDEDVFGEGLKAHLCHVMGRPDVSSVFQTFEERLKDLLADQKQDVGLPTQMPAAF